MTKGGDTGAVLPLLPLRGMLVFPNMVAPLEIGRDRSIAAIEQAMLQDQRILLVAQKDARVSEPTPDEIYRVGIVALVKQLLRMPEGQIKVLVEGVGRWCIDEFIHSDPYYSVCATAIDEPERTGVEVEALVRATKRHFSEYESLNKKTSGPPNNTLDELDDPSQIADIVSSQLKIALDEKQRLLEITDPAKRLESLCVVLAKEIQVLQLDKKIQMRVRKQMERSQREYYLREQMKAIQKELGERDDRTAEVDELRERIEGAKMPKTAKEKALHELGRFEKMPPVAAEAVVVRNYLDWLVSLPWSKRTADRTDLRRAESILDQDHYALEKVKERICEFLAVRQLAKKMKGPVLCLVGPPGVGKTSLARSVARALKRKFVRFSLGGVRDEAEIRGHRRTYVGAMPGKVLQAMRQAETKNPVLLLDEIDKTSADFRGDPAASLLEVFDPEQNHAFGDHYLEIPFDLSEVMFITTANVGEAIPRPLRDRMEIIQLSGYTAEEKWHIAKAHLVPRQVKEHGLKVDQMHISDNTLRRLITGYTRESGVRGLERSVAAVCRKATREILGGKERVLVNVRTVERYLGRPRFRADRSEGEDRVGIAQGLAYTEVGGGLILIEVSVVEGKGRLTLTGQLGDVMRESAQAGYSYIRSRAENLGVSPEFYEKSDVHIHVPEGAVPKEGPSAGITIAVALASALSGRLVRSEVAMTGEITLRGRVLPVGGVKEKLLAAHRAGIERIILPKENEKDLEEIPANVRRRLHIYAVEHMDEVLEIALAPAADERDAAFEEDVEPSMLLPETAAVAESWIEGNAS